MSFSASVRSKKRSQLASIMPHTSFAGERSCTLSCVCFTDIEGLVPVTCTWSNTPTPRQLGAREALTLRPGLTSQALAERLGTHPFYTDVLCRIAFAFGLLDCEGAGLRIAPHFDQILGDPESGFYLARTPN
jgi:hypothetical protein